MLESSMSSLPKNGPEIAAIDVLLQLVLYIHYI